MKLHIINNEVYKNEGWNNNQGNIIYIQIQEYMSLL